MKKDDISNISKKTVTKFLSKASEVSSSTSQIIQDGSKVVTDKGKGAILLMQDNSKALKEKNQIEAYNRRLKKYNPLFPEVYISEDFNLPNMIKIVDDAVRKGIDVCEGAMGWLDNVNGIEVLFLYDEFIEFSGIHFIPSANCDDIYYVDNFNRKNFIRTDYIFTKAHEEKLAELKHIAYSLGAKNCFIEITESRLKGESSNLKTDSQAKFNLNTNVSLSQGYEKNQSYLGENHLSGKIIVHFEGSNDIVEPQLKWYAKDDNIKRLIDMRINKKNQVKSETIELSGSSSATMNQSTAVKIDAAISKIGIGNNTAMSSKAVQESNSKLIFSIEF